MNYPVLVSDISWMFLIYFYFLIFAVKWGIIKFKALVLLKEFEVASLAIFLFSST